MSLVAIQISSVWLAFDATQVQQITILSSIVPLPRAPNHIEGLTLVGSKALPVLDLAAFLGLDRGRDPLDRAIVVADRDLVAAIRCHVVKIVDDISPDRLRSAVVASGRLAELARGELEVDLGLMQVLDLRGVLEAARVRA